MDASFSKTLISIVTKIQLSSLDRPPGLCYLRVIDLSVVDEMNQRGRDCLISVYDMGKCVHGRIFVVQIKF